MRFEGVSGLRSSSSQLQTSSSGPNSAEECFLLLGRQFGRSASSLDNPSDDNRHDNHLYNRRSNMDVLDVSIAQERDCSSNTVPVPSFARILLSKCWGCRQVLILETIFSACRRTRATKCLKASALVRQRGTKPLRWMAASL